MSARTVEAIEVTCDYRGPDAPTCPSSTYLTQVEAAACDRTAELESRSWTVVSGLYFCSRHPAPRIGVR